MKKRGLIVQNDGFEGDNDSRMEEVRTDDDDDEGYVPHDGVGFTGDDEYYDYDELENIDNEDYYYEGDGDDDEFKRNKFFESTPTTPWQFTEIRYLVN
ncbi:hypothetical protein Cantr_01199 [Candida viswanathii]|uniref:Uncharacterized protein n=1 Tax=Candida viswanathii TaxID=5486 RepID=A0A367YIA7_9ASCO|nr:hypothetical protein Cantr_01199 [Candida viswanathii]